MSRWIVFAGITAMLVTGYFATFYERGQGPLRAVKFLPGELKSKVQTALKSKGAAWVQVEMDGQRAILTGTAPSELDRDDALEIVRHAAGQGGTVWGGVTKVDGESIRVAASQKPFTWSAQLGDAKRVSLRGFVPSRQFKNQIAAEARKLFPGGIDDQTVVASGQPTGDWMATALHGLSYLVKLATGEVRMEDNRITIVGEAQDDRARDDIGNGFQAVKRPFEAFVTLSDVDRSNVPPVNITDEDPSEIAGESVQRLPAADCQKLIDTAMRGNIVLFGLNSTEVNPAGKGKITLLAQTALRCPDLKLKVTGHADGNNEVSKATDLSRQRAFVAAKMLTDGGIASDRLIVTGVGATQPDVENDSNDPAPDRRVEFTVIP